MSCFGTDFAEFTHLFFGYVHPHPYTKVQHAKIIAGALAFILLIALAGCTKDEEILIPGNVAPPDPTVENVVKENYVNKLYISVLGRKPDSAEYAQGLVILDKNNLSIDNRHELLDIILGSPEYNTRVYDLARAELLNGLDTAEVGFLIQAFEPYLADTTSPLYPAYVYELGRLYALRDVPKDFSAGAINLIGLHRRAVNNFFYDEINMGTENFVVSMFQNFLLRYPTQTELEQSSRIVDGFTGVLFYQTGDSKDEFLDIFLAASDYFEGQVRGLFVRYLFRQPTSEEMSAHAGRYKSSLEYKALQKDVLSMDEFVGL